jgi:hypothetical protein
MLVDSHVHIHACYDLDVMFDAAARNFRRAARSNGAHAARSAPLGCLALTETARDHAFAALAGRGPGSSTRHWSVRATDDEAAVVCASSTGDEIIVIAGSQIVTAERLEVLALATARRYPDGRSLPATLEALAADHVPAVIPWGFGKWWLKRGRLLANLLDHGDARAFFLGDNGGRPALTPRPRLFHAAESRGFRILPGTDLFPYKSQQRKAGSYGFVLDAWEVDARPAAQLRQQLQRLEGSPPVYGSRVNVLEFTWLQVAMNVRNRLPHEQ